MTKKSQFDSLGLLEVRPQNILSFGPQTAPLRLEKLNLFIGPNGSGKSNLIETLALMRATPIAPQASSTRDVRSVIRQGGGAQEWIWKGDKGKPASMKVTLGNSGGPFPIRHLFAFNRDEQGFVVENEQVVSVTSSQRLADFSYLFSGRVAAIRSSRLPGPMRVQKVITDQSILSQRNDPERFPELSLLAETYQQWRIYREWSFGRHSIFREPQRADMRNDRLEEDFSNLGLFLSRLRKSPKAKRAVLEGLQDLYEGITDFELVVEGGTVQVFFAEGDYFIPATRLSDGTLRYLCILAILCDPSPPPLVCIEEPELGLHPDILPKLADLMVAASERMQLIVTTHSDILVDAMTERPEVVVVCEKREGCTEMRRLKKDELKVWLEEYRLGQLWSKGQIGGNRW